MIPSYRINNPVLNIGILLISILLEGSIGMSIIRPEYKVLFVTLWYLEVIIFEKHILFPVKLGILMLIWWLYEFFLFYIGYSSASIGNYMNTLLFYDIIIKSIFILYNYNDYQKKVIFSLTILILLSNIAISWYYLSVLGDEYLEMYRNSEYYEDSGFFFVGTSFYNSLVFFIGLQLYQLRKSSLLYSIISFFLVCIALIFMLSIETRAISLFLTIALCLIIIIKTTTKSKRKFVWIGLVLVVLFSSTIISGLIEVLPERVAIRLSALFNPKSGESETYLTRFDLAMVDLKTFTSSLDNFLWGIGDHRGRDYWNLIGQHSFLLDTLAKYGLIGAIFVVKIIASIYVAFKKGLSGSLFNNIFVPMFVVFILMSFTSHSFDVIIGVSCFVMIASISHNDTDLVTRK